ncbi:MAG: hypothetical protein QNJ70_22555 [Xenococcaceae cyanobacterium MO_207.B15]|nr:hypothetical protein [Xenococcaceae cyanobacterium MO_207.B15]
MGDKWYEMEASATPLTSSTPHEETSPFLPSQSTFYQLTINNRLSNPMSFMDEMS